MRSRDRFKGWRASLNGFGVILLFCLFWTAAVQADAQLEGEGDLGRRNLTNQTLEIDGEVYSFTESSIIVDRQGKVVALEALDVQDERGPTQIQRLQSGRFSAIEVGGRYVIQRLELIEPPH